MRLTQKVLVNLFRFLGDLLRLFTSFVVTAILIRAVDISLVIQRSRSSHVPSVGRSKGCDASLAMIDRPVLL